MSNVLKMALVSIMYSMMLVPMMSPTVAQATMSKEALAFTESGAYLTPDATGSVALEKPMNRAEFAAILVRLTGLPTEGMCERYPQFSDVKDNMWFGGAVCLLGGVGLINGYEDGTFRAGNLVTFVEVAKVLSLGVVGEPREGDMWFEPYVQFLSDQHAIPTSVTSLVQPVTKGEFMEILYRLRTQDTSLASNAYSADSRCILVSMDKFYAKTTHSVYFYPPQGDVAFGSGALLRVAVDHVGVRIDSADVASFEILELPFYAKDKHHVYYMGQVVQSASAESFRSLDALYGYAKDKDRAYYKGQPIATADIAGFTALGSYYAKDALRVYYAGTPLMYVDSATFEVIANGYAKDKNKVYYRNKVVEGADARTFVVMNVDYGKDKTQVYYQHTLIKPADATQFVVLRDLFSRDDDSVFFEEDILEGADVATFEVLDGYYAKTKDAVYYGSTRIAEADAATFHIDAHGKASDDYAHYYMGQRVVSSVK